MGRQQGQKIADKRWNDHTGASGAKTAISGRTGQQHNRDGLSNSVEKSLGTTLRQLRQACGMNQTELGRRLGVSLQQIQKYESGANRMAASTVFRSAEILGVDVGALFAGATMPAARSSRASKSQRRSYLVIPLSSGARSTSPREAELIEVAKNYQAIGSASERALVRKLLKRLSLDPQQARAGSR